MAYEFDNYERNEAHAIERDESRSAQRGLTEVDRARNCGHTRRSRCGTCYDCGDQVDP